MFTCTFYPYVESGRWKGALDLCVLSPQNGNRWRGDFLVYVYLQMVKTTGGPAMGASVSSPALTNAAVTLLQDNLNQEERQLWTSLGPNWTLPRLDYVIMYLCQCVLGTVSISHKFHKDSTSSRKTTISVTPWRLSKIRLNYVYNGNCNVACEWVEERPTLLCFSSQLRGPLAPYVPVFFDGWKPETLRPDGQVWEDPVESQHKHEDLQVKREVWNACVWNSLHCRPETTTKYMLMLWSLTLFANKHAAPMKWKKMCQECSVVCWVPTLIRVCVCVSFSSHLSLLDLQTPAAVMKRTTFF